MKRRWHRRLGRRAVRVRIKHYPLMWVGTLLTGSVLAQDTSTGSGQAFPMRPVRIIVGPGPDIIGCNGLIVRKNYNEYFQYFNLKASGYV